jgi:carbon storage regulator
MLVLSRRKDETIRIDDSITITVVDIRGEKVRIGISAPPNVSVHRGEIYDIIQKENKRS